MKIIKKTSILAMLVFGLMSCNSETESLEFEEANLTSKKSKSLESTVNQQLRTPGTPTAVDLGVAGDFTILSKSGVTNVPGSVITGHVGTSPIAQTAITGFGLTLDASGEFATSAQVTGNIYAASAASPTPSMLTTAVLDMQAAYTDAASRPVSSGDHLNVGAGNIGGETLVPGVYKWTSTLLIPEDITLAGGPNDVWIFQVAGTLTMSNGKKMNLSGGAKAKNIFWQVSGAVTLGTTSHFEGILLGATSIAVQTNAIVNGRLLAQTAVTLQMNTVTEPVAEPVAAAIGDLRDGGIVFWVDPTDNNTHGLVCYTEDAPNKLNWHDAMAYCAALEAGTYNDWYLPSKVEINLMQIGNASLGNIGGFEAYFYWSSTDDNSAFFAWGHYFPIGGYGYGFKHGAYNVRAVRAF